MKKMFLMPALAISLLFPAFSGAAMGDRKDASDTSVSTGSGERIAGLWELKDGRNIRINPNDDSLQFADKAGKKSPVPDGSYELKNGETWVAKDGKLADRIIP